MSVKLIKNSGMHYNACCLKELIRVWIRWILIKEYFSRLHIPHYSLGYIHITHS